MTAKTLSYWVELTFEDEDCQRVGKPKKTKIKNADLGWETVLKFKEKQIAKLKETFGKNDTTVILCKDSQLNEMSIENKDDYTS